MAAEASRNLAFVILEGAAPLRLYQTRYNTFRPHQALNQDTPLGYYEKNHAMVA